MSSLWRGPGCRCLGVLTAALLLLLSLGCGGNATPPSGDKGDSTPPVRVGRAVVATYHNNNARTGVNAGETTLTPANVNPKTFGRVAALTTEGDIYAQPLYIPNVSMGANGVHNLVIVATQHDQVYAFDVDTKQQMWSMSYLDENAGITTVSADDVGCHSIGPELGITGTPVIDTSTNVMYLVARTKQVQGGAASYYQTLHAVDLATGRDRVRPMVITGPASGGEYGIAQFDPLVNLQRAALLLSGGQVYVAWASHCDVGWFQGWLMSFDPATLRMTAAWTPDPSGYLGGIWMGGGGPAADANGEIYVVVGNGQTDNMLGGSNYGDSVVRLHPEGDRLLASDYFTPYNFGEMFNEDIDLGSGAPVLLPHQAGAAHPNLLTMVGKDATAYLLDRDNLGHWKSDDNGQIVQSFEGDSGFSITTPAFWNDTVYYSWTRAPVEAHAYDPIAQQINPTPSSASATLIGYPGATPAISANGSDNGILWLLSSWTGHNMVLYGFDATNLTTELYNSDMMPDRDQAGLSVKMTVPTVADGMVFVGTRGELDIYGLLPN